MSIFTDFDWVEKMKEEVGEMAERRVMPSKICTF
jgi:hypothetical protein